MARCHRIMTMFIDDIFKKRSELQILSVHFEMLLNFTFVIPIDTECLMHCFCDIPHLSQTCSAKQSVGSVCRVCLCVRKFADAVNVILI